MRLKSRIKKEHKQWSKLILNGTERMESGDCQGALARFGRARTLAVRLMDATVLEFDGDILFLEMYSHSAACMQEVYQKMGDPAAAEACLTEAKQKYFSVLRNTAYPTLVRGRAIRSLKDLINLAVRFYDAEGKQEKAYETAEAWIQEVRQFVAKMQPLSQTVAMN